MTSTRSDLPRSFSGAPALSHQFFDVDIFIPILIIYPTFQSFRQIQSYNLGRIIRSLSV